jgi:hypothetical protein
MKKPRGRGGIPSRLGGALRSIRAHQAAQVDVILRCELLRASKDVPQAPLLHPSFEARRRGEHLTGERNCVHPGDDGSIASTYAARGFRNSSVVDYPLGIVHEKDNHRTRLTPRAMLALY